QNESFEFRWRDGEQKTSVLAERVFEQQCVGVEDLFLNLRHCERLWLPERGVAWTGGPNLRVEQALLLDNRVQIRFDRGRLLAIAPRLAEHPDALGLGGQPLLQFTFAVE